MRTPKFTVKRAVSMTVAGALAIAGTVAVANIAQAASTAIKISPAATGSTAGGNQLTVTGTGFQDSTGADVAAAVRFILGTTCGVDATAGTAATAFNVVSKTKVGVTSPAVAAGSWMLCIFDGTTATQTLLGGGKFVVAAPATATTISGAVTNVAKASALGGTTVVVTGTNFSKTTTATIDGVKAAATYVSATKLSVKLPAHAAGTGFSIKVDNGYGSAMTTDTVSFVPVVTVSPTSGNGTAGNVVTITGSGFSGRTFSEVAGISIAFLPAGTALVSGTTTIASLDTCTSVMVESDTTLSCKAPALTTGAYSVQFLTALASEYDADYSTISKSATYTVAAF
ncbi:IPT/TIG domain-containing protein [Kineosporia sp. NBRC 101731]|uniref:IPT/TIG domain-containing protein n=1 Tax=Kineosporia sp. NBRC 101731 TaxID=3032199 RepID=UPI0024A43C4E|nr:IPT/TIG domain-containing protein [Kineosporia sp. NBRC 101731]GLY27074.1 hypothetical protein Kisp02_04390 [Kineosporia sp. NBRC 101731]